MTYQNPVVEIQRRIDDAISLESWDRARLCLRELARVLVDATISGDGPLIAQIDEALSQAYFDLSLDDEFDSDLTLSSIAWSADGLRDVAQLARRRRPALPIGQRAIVLRDAKARILALLSEGNGAPKNNREIAERLGLNVATVARIMTILREEKKVRSWPEGRFMMNEIAHVQDNRSIELQNAEKMEFYSESFGPGKRDDIRNNEITEFDTNTTRIESRLISNDTYDIKIEPDFIVRISKNDALKIILKSEMEALCSDLIEESGLDPGLDHPEVFLDSSLLEKFEKAPNLGNNNFSQNVISLGNIEH